MIDYNVLLKELQGIYGGEIKRINKIIGWYDIYEGERQKWDVTEDLDYTPTQKITNHTKKLIDKRARFMFGKEPYFDIRPAKPDAKGQTTNADKAQAKEDILYKILKKNMFHSKLLKGGKDCRIGGKVAIKLWAQKDEGLKIIFSPAMEFFVIYDEDDIDNVKKIILLYFTNAEADRKKQRIDKQSWEMNGDKCILNEAVYDGTGELVEELYTDYDTGLDFIPVIIIQNGGLTGETEGKSDIEQLIDNANAYNKLTSDDIDALRFQMFGQDVITDAAEQSIKNIKVAPGAMVDLQTDQAVGETKQAKMERLESSFSYSEKFQDTVNRIKNDMYDTLDVPNVGLEQLKGLMQSGKSMKALYWELMSACDEDWTEWGPALEQMVDYIFKMVEVYNLYDAREIVRFETTMIIQHTYPIPEDEDDEQKLDLEKVTAQTMSKRSYIKKWQDIPDVDAELEQIQKEQQMLQDSFTRAVQDELNQGDNQ